MLDEASGGGALLVGEGMCARLLGRGRLVHIGIDWGRLSSDPRLQEGIRVEPRWVVLRCQPRRERLAALAVKSRGVESYLPRFPKGRSRPEPPLFPGYLFARVLPDTDDLLRIRSAPGVAYILPRLGTPAPLPDGLMEAIQSRERALRSGRPPHAFHRGEHVRVKSGPFKWVEGLFDRRLSGAGRVRILLETVHGTFTVQMGGSDLEPIKA